MREEDVSARFVLCKLFAIAGMDADRVVDEASWNEMCQLRCGVGARGAYDVLWIIEPRSWTL